MTDPSDEELARRGLSRHTDLRLDVRGRFFSGAQPITHPGVARAFARWLDRLHREPAGGHLVAWRGSRVTIRVQR